MTFRFAFFHIVLALFATAAWGQGVKLVERKPDPHGTPRPARGAEHVPLGTSIYFELTPDVAATDDRIIADSVTIKLKAQGGEEFELLGRNGKFSPGVLGWLRPRELHQGLNPKSLHGLAVYVELGRALDSGTSYTVSVSARSEQGGELNGALGRWSFRTEEMPVGRRLELGFDFNAQPVRWKGHFFSGVCNVLFCTDEKTFGPTYELMAKARQEHPRAWSYQRDFWLTGMEDRKPQFFAHNLPNIVRERETRRIVSIDPRADGVVLRVEDFFGHEQYGIADRRPLAGDYRPGDEVLIADALSDARAKVLSVDDESRAVLVSTFKTPEAGWKLEYEGPLPEKGSPNMPGLFPPGGCYLRKFNPVGTPCFYWGRLDKEWDLAHRRYGRRLLVNFADAAGDLSRDGRSWTTVKDYAQWHEAARTISGHIIDRYGDDALTFTWSIFNEPDLGALFWRADWDELQKYYDYTTDAVLRAFEDRGYDSSKVFIGGLELGGIFGVNLKLKEFLAHCSPRAEAPGAMPLNAAVADERLAGKRSRRVESLCGAHRGKGSPCDFVSIHAYNNSEVMAAKLAKAKAIALEIDAEYYRDLWINSHEACPDWNLPPDEAAGDSYLGNGYFPSWCADVVARQLEQAARDPRYAMGETLLTVWPPPHNFAGLNAVTRVLQCDDDGDGRSDRGVTVPMPIFHMLNHLSDLGDNYWVLAPRQEGGHRVMGFASRDEKGNVRVLLASHHAGDTQSRSDVSFDVALALKGLGTAGPVQIDEYRFDRENNSYFRQAKELTRGTKAANQAYAAAAMAEVVRLAECRAQSSTARSIGSDGALRLDSHLSGNGVNIIVIRPKTAADGNRP
jgi:hypothetical protein